MWAFWWAALVAAVCSAITPSVPHRPAGGALVGLAHHRTRRTGPRAGPVRWLEEDDEDASIPIGISSAQMEVLKDYYKGVPPGHPDRLVVEIVDQRLDNGALVVMVTAIV